MPSLRKWAALAAVVMALALLWAHQAMTKDKPRELIILSTSDVIGYLTPCG